jgi:RNA polymerase sigma-70 factor (ECF subfamily)
MFEPLRDPSNHEAWERFMERYRPMVRQWCWRWFPQAEADAMAFEVFVVLLEKIRTFQYNPTKGRFRGWLKTLTHRLMARMKRRGKIHFVPGDFLDDLAAEEDLAKRIDAEFDLELLELAKESVRSRVEDQTWRIFVEIVERGRKPADVAVDMGIRVGTVYQAKYAVIQALKAETKAAESRYDIEVHP